MITKFNDSYNRLNLPMCLSFMNQGTDESCVPEDLKLRLNTAKAKGNPEAIKGFFKQLTEREQANMQMLSQIEQVLKTEQEQDTMLRQSGGNVNGRVPSDMAQRHYLEAINKYRKDMGQASEANKKLLKMFEDNQQGFSVLFLNPTELEEMFEQFKAKKASADEVEQYEKLKHA